MDWRAICVPAASLTIHELVLRELDLSKEQKEQIAKIEQQFVGRQKAREAESHAANTELATAFNELHQYSPEVQKAVEHFHKAMGELQNETVEHVLEIRKVLCLDQADNFDRRVSEALTNHTP